MVAGVSIPSASPYLLRRWGACGKAAVYRPDYARGIAGQQGQLDSVGGFAYLAELSKNTPSAANIGAYADIVRERAVVRDMIAVAHEIADAGLLFHRAQ